MPGCAHQLEQGKTVPHLACCRAELQYSGPTLSPLFSPLLPLPPPAPLPPSPTLASFLPPVVLALRQDMDSPVKATDFGLSIRHRPEDPPLKSRSGTPAYMAPEVIQQCYDERADMWSAGIMMYQLLTGGRECCGGEGHPGGGGGGRGGGGGGGGGGSQGAW
jgi:hypothetical protein